MAKRAARRGIHGRASLTAADGNHLVPRPDSDGEGAGASAQNRVGAIVERLKGWKQAAPTDPDEGGEEQLGWQLARQLGARIVPRQRRSRNIQGFGKLFDNGVDRKFIILQKFIWQDNLCIENCFSRGKTSGPRSTKGNSSDHVAAAARARSVSLRQRCSRKTAPFDSG
jgi:hypothetical protein